MMQKVTLIKVGKKVVALHKTIGGGGVCRLCGGGGGDGCYDGGSGHCGVWCW